MRLVLLTVSNTKMAKSPKYGYLSLLLHLRPYTGSGYNVCQYATPGCSGACLNFAGRGQMNMVQLARVRRTKLFFEDRETFMRMLVADIRTGIRCAERKGFIPCFRLNGTSDIPWERVKVPHEGKTVFELFPDITFYDYTKYPYGKRNNLPENYLLTYSYAGDAPGSGEFAQEWLEQGYNVAVVFSPELPETFWGYRVIDGDTHDLRFLDPRPAIVGLRPKGNAKKDTSGFVVHLQADNTRLAA